MGRIRTVVFDIGKVLADFVWREYLVSLGYEPKVQEILANAIFLDPMWNERDRGAYPEEYYVEAFKKNAPGYEKQIEEVFAGIQDAVVEYPFSVDWVRSIKKQGYQVLLLSNYAEVSFRYARERFESLGLADGGVISYEEKVVKPDKRIYEILLERYHLIAEETLFLDDLEANVKAAEALGIHTIHVTSHENAVQELKERFGIESTCE